jgi:hypothetical protein
LDPKHEPAGEKIKKEGLEVQQMIICKIQAGFYIEEHTGNDVMRSQLGKSCIMEDT